jgi:hypothetical protein
MLAEGPGPVEIAAASISTKSFFLQNTEQQSRSFACATLFFDFVA